MTFISFSSTSLYACEYMATGSGFWNSRLGSFNLLRKRLQADGILPESTAPYSTATVCSKPFSAKEFFEDVPWFNIPPERRAVITIEPLYPRGGLLGGSQQNAPKVSKLAALAAARKKKENLPPTSSDTKAVNRSVALLDRLNLKSDTDEQKPNNTDGPSREEQKDAESASEKRSFAGSVRKYPAKRRKSETPPPQRVEDIQAPEKAPDTIPEEPAPVLTTPSQFANIMLGRPSQTNDVTAPTPILLAYHISLIEASGKISSSNPFAGPSPDDIVSNAQSASKGLKKPPAAKQ